MKKATSGARWILGGVAAFGVVLALSIASQGAPAPRPASISPSAFSAERAQVHLRALAEAPRPLGSEAHERAREYIAEELRSQGYAPIQQESLGCGLFGACAKVKNVLARLEGKRGGKAVLLMAHYDSVSGGPGASDDGVGVAALLEVARALRHRPPLVHPVIFLIDDGEESGLIGASVFRADHPWMAEVGAIVNLEARGTSGPSLLFETTGDSGWLAGALRSLPHPRASSAYAAIYSLLPNDTDLTIFKSDGLPGVNFAFIGDAGRYHTPFDDVHHASPSSLQHHGDNSLSIVQHLAEGDLGEGRKGGVVFFDLLGTWVLSWPESWSLPMAMAAAMALAVAAVIALRKDRLSLRKLAWGGGAFLSVPLVSAPVAWVMLRCWGLGIDKTLAFPRTWVAYPAPALMAVWSVGLAVSGAASVLVRHRAGGEGLWMGIGLGWTTLALVSALVVPGASYLFTLPALTASIAGIIWGLGGWREQWLGIACTVTLVVGGLLLFPVLWMSYDAVGLLPAPVVAALVALIGLLLAPLVPGVGRRQWLVPTLPAVAALIGTLAAVALPLASKSRPEPLVLAHHEVPETGSARWLAFKQDERLPESLRRVASFGARREKPFDWGGRFPTFVAPAPLTGAEPPRLELVSREEQGDKRNWRGRLRSPRGATEIYLAFAPDAPLDALFLDGKRVSPPEERVRSWYGGWQVYRFLGVPPAGVEVQVVLRRDAEPVAVEVVDRTTGLPPNGAALAASRPPETITIQDGDSHYVSCRVSL